jgi:hypothetical protein
MQRFEIWERLKSGSKPLTWFHFWGGLCFLVALLSLAFTGHRAMPATEEGEAIISPSTAVVHTRGTWRLSFIVKADSMAVGGGVKIRFIKGFHTIQINDPNLPNYVSARTSNPQAKVVISSLSQTDPQVKWDWDRNGWVVTALVRERALNKGDTIQVVFGANPPQGRIVPPPSTFIDTVKVAYDPDGSGIYREVVREPTLEIVPASPKQLVGYLPSTITAGAPAKLKIVALDYYDNLATSFVGTAALAATDSLAAFPQTLDWELSDSGRRTIEVVFNTPGVHYVKLSVLRTNQYPLWEAHSNPVSVVSETALYQVFWGDLHSHSSFSHDGHGTNSFFKARDVACLDFYARTDHTSNNWKTNGGLTPQEWEATKREITRFHEPGKFVTFPAYEFSANPPSGHHNIYFNAPDELVPEVPLFRDDVYHQVQKVWTLKEAMVPPGIDMITAPHHTGIIFDINVNNPPLVSFGEGFSNSKLRPLIEIYSNHGLSEYYNPAHPLSYKMLDLRGIRDCSNGPHYAQDAWAGGEILGVIASSDDHTSRPGLPYYGLTAVYAAELTRDAIFDALKNRRTYGTTGQRMLLHFDIDGSVMGSQVEVARGKYPTIRLEVHGTDDLDFVEVLRWDKTSGRRMSGHPFFAPIHRIDGAGRRGVQDQFVDSTYSGSSIYYLRAKQQRDIFDSTNQLYRQAWAWSSPIWVDEPRTLDTTNTEPLPSELQLRQNFPNPFDRHTVMTYYLPRDGKVEATLYNALGQHVRTLVNDFQFAGWHDLQVYAYGLAHGIYFVRLKAAGQAMTRKIVLMEK